MGASFARDWVNIRDTENEITRYLGQCQSDTSSSASQCFADAKIKFLPKEGPGKRFHVDIALCARKNAGSTYSSSFFDKANYYIDMRLLCHNINGQWNVKNGFNVNGGYIGGDADGWVQLGKIKPQTLIATSCWDGQSIKPRYGCVQARYAALTPRGINTSMSGATAESRLRSIASPYVGSGVTTFFAGEPVGVRYLSRQGQCRTSDGRRQSQVGASLRAYTAFSRNILDEGTDNDGPLIDFTSSQGEDIFRIELRVYRDIWNDHFYWVVTEGELDRKIDNPLMGYPDVKWPGDPNGENWQPRFDAQFQYKDGSTWKNQKTMDSLQGKHKQGSWQVF